MPRAKRYQNLQKSVQPASTSQGVAQPLSTTESTPSYLDDTPVRAAAQPAHSVQTTSQLDPSVHAASQPIQSKKRPGRECPQHWTVDVIDMSRAKRYQNLQKSVQPAHSVQTTSQPAPSVRATAQPAHSVQATSQPAPSVRAATQPAHSVQATSQPASSVHAASQPTQSKKCPGRECPQHWTVDAIDMSRAKRYQNLQKSVQPAHSVLATSQPAPSVRAAAQPAHSVQATSQPVPSVRAATQPAHSVQATSQPAPSVQAASQPTQSKKHPGRKCPQHWTVDAIDSQGATKILKVKVKDVMYLSNGKRIVVEFDDMDQPIGEGQGVLAGFCGILATDCSLFPIHFNKWPDLPKSYFNCCYDQIIKPRFCFETTELNARTYVYGSIGKKWGSGRQRLWYEFNDPLKTKAEIMDNVPLGIPRDQWTSYVAYRLDEKTMEMSKRNAEIRKKQIVAHTGGSKPNSRRRAEMIAESGQNPGRAQLYLATHKKEDGSYVNEAAREICEKIELVVSQSATDESEISPNDAVGKVLGKEHSGRVRCLGLGAIPSKVFRQTRRHFGSINSSSCDTGSCSSKCEEKYNQIINAHNQSQEKYNRIVIAHNQSQENYAQMMTAHLQMMNAFKTYMIMKEGTIPEQFAGIFVSPPPAAPSDAASGSISPMGVRGSSIDSNLNENH